MRAALLAAVLLAFSALAGAQAAPAGEAAGHFVRRPNAAVMHADYFYHGHHFRHRRWWHHHWAYY